MFAAATLLSGTSSVRRSPLLFIVLAAIPTIFMIGLRWEVGTDWQPYLEIFNYTKLYSLNQVLRHVDPGFNVLMWLLHRIDASFWMLNLICGTIFISGLSAFCLRQSNPWLAFLVAFPYLVIVIGMSGSRQSVALGFLFFALNAFERNRLFQFATLIIIGALFHGSVLLMLPLCLLTNSQQGLRRILLLAIVGAIGYFYFTDVFNVYARRYANEGLQSSGTAFRLAMNCLAALVFLTFKRRLGFEPNAEKLWNFFALMTIGLAALWLMAPSSTAIDRFLLYLFPLQFVVFSRLPGALAVGRQTAGQWTAVVIVYAATVQFTFLSFGTFASSFIPYRSILRG